MLHSRQFSAFYTSFLILTILGFYLSISTFPSILYFILNHSQFSTFPAFYTSFSTIPGVLYPILDSSHPILDHTQYFIYPFIDYSRLYNLFLNILSFLYPILGTLNHILVFIRNHSWLWSFIHDHSWLFIIHSRNSLHYLLHFQHMHFPFMLTYSRVSFQFFIQILMD